MSVLTLHPFVWILIVSCADEMWTVRVFIIPLALFVLVALRYSCEKRGADSANAYVGLKANVFVIIFLICKQQRFGSSSRHE